MRKYLIFSGCIALLTGVLFTISCGTTDGSAGTGMGTAAVSISDPATCAGPTGMYAHVYVTITDVRANVSSSASDSDSGWTDLTPNLGSKQIDLLGQTNNSCFLATLGDPQELQAGNYQQIRLILAPNSASVSNNACLSAGTANCVVLNADSSVHALQLSSEAQTGIKIPSGQIASGGFNIAAGQTKDLDIDFNTCASIVQTGNGAYILKPVLHAGEVTTTSTSINGSVVDNATGKPVTGNVMVALEQKDAAGIDRVVMTTMAGTDGSFVFCPIPAGTYDVVIVGVGATGAAYNPSIVTGVANGQTTGMVNLYASAQGTATFTGVITSQNSSNAATVADANLTALESVSSGAIYTIPDLPVTQPFSAILTVETAASTSTLTCPSGTDCAAYSLVVPSGGAYIGAYSTSGSTLTQSAALASYFIDGIADTCTPSEAKSQSFALTGTGPFTITVSNALALTACQ